MKLVIYGAQGYALGAYEAIKTLYPKREILCFLVTSMGINSSFLGGIPVQEIGPFASRMRREEKEGLEVLIATPDDVQSDIEETLENYGLRNYRKLDSDRWSSLMMSYFIRKDIFTPISILPVGCTMPFVRVYMASSSSDRLLKNLIAVPDEVIPVHAGASIDEFCLAEIRDNFGENISDKNKNYSELTVLYWVWKNKLCVKGSEDGERNQYFGLSQYRRVLVLSEDDMTRIVDNDIDAILPFPMPYEPDIEVHHRRYLKDEDWDAVLKAIEELQPEYAAYLPGVLSQQWLYNYNIILARKGVLREYCEWLFPILERVEELSVPKGYERQDRYIGYIAETLETLYFLKNADRLNVFHTGSKQYV